jgi:hypothetical protein
MTTSTQDATEAPWIETRAAHGRVSFSGDRIVGWTRRGLPPAVMIEDPPDGERSALRASLLSPHVQTVRVAIGRAKDPTTTALRVAGDLAPGTSGLRLRVGSGPDLVFLDRIRQSGRVIGHGRQCLRGPEITALANALRWLLQTSKAQQEAAT